jgi:hypothetical protein
MATSASALSESQLYSKEESKGRVWETTWQREQKVSKTAPPSKTI